MRWIVVLVLLTAALAACESEPATESPGAEQAPEVTPAQAKADEPTQAEADEPACPHLAAQARAAEHGEPAGCSGKGKHAGEPCPCAAAGKPCSAKGEGCDCGCKEGGDCGCKAGGDCGCKTGGDCGCKEGGDCGCKEGCSGGCKGAHDQASPHAMAPTSGCPYLDSLDHHDVEARPHAAAGVRL